MTKQENHFNMIKKMTTRCFAFCTTVSGDALTNHGLFDSIDEMEKEFARFETHMEAHDVKTFAPEVIIFEGNYFTHEKHNFCIFPVIPGYDYCIDGEPSSMNDDGSSPDRLLVDTTDLDEFDIIPIIYLIKGKFVCGLECSSYLPPDVLLKAVRNL